MPSERMPISRSMRPFDSGLQGVDVACVMYSSRAAEINSGALSDAKVCHRVLPPNSRMAMTHDAFVFFFEANKSLTAVPRSFNRRP